MSRTNNKRLTVKELIEILKKYPEGMSVMGIGYEEGFYDLGEPKKVKVVRDMHEQTEWYYGPHDLASELGPEHKNKTVEEVLIF